MKSPFSNLHKCKFVDSEGIVYNCSEQYIMAEKAKLFGDDKIREIILTSTDPYEQKELGRKVSNFNLTTWEENCKEIVYKGCYLKFSQNIKLLDSMAKTHGTLLAEASPTDKIWGIGLDMDDPRIHDKKNWPGQNRLGEILTRLRDDILSK